MPMPMRRSGEANLAGTAARDIALAAARYVDIAGAHHDHVDGDGRARRYVTRSPHRDGDPLGVHAFGADIPRARGLEGCGIHLAAADVEVTGAEEPEIGRLGLEHLQGEIAGTALHCFDLLAAIFLDMGIAGSVHRQPKDRAPDGVERE